MSVEEQIQPGATRWRVATGFWMALIFALSSALFAPRMSFDATLDFFGAINYAARKCAHAFEFGILMWLWFRALYPRPFSLGKARGWAILLSALYAASDELHQSFVPLRSGKATDVLSDAAGILAVAYLIGKTGSSTTQPLLSKLFGIHPSRAEDNDSPR